MCVCVRARACKRRPNLPLDRLHRLRTQRLAVELLGVGKEFLDRRGGVRDARRHDSDGVRHYDHRVRVGEVDRQSFVDVQSEGNGVLQQRKLRA